MAIDLCAENLKPLLWLRKVSETLAVFSKVAEVNCPDALKLHSTLTVMQSYTTLKGRTAVMAPHSRVKGCVWAH